MKMSSPEVVAKPGASLRHRSRRPSRRGTHFLPPDPAQHGGHPSPRNRNSGVAYVIHFALKRNLLFRIGYSEGITALQQWLLIYILGGLPFDIVDFFISELEDVIMEGLTSSRRQPYAHWISWILTQLDQGAMMHNLESSTTSFKDYSPTSPNDGRRGARGQRRAEQRLRERAQAEAAAAEDPFAAADTSLAAAEAQLPHFLATTDSEGSEDDEDYTPTVPV